VRHTKLKNGGKALIGSEAKKPVPPNGGTGKTQERVDI
jgi:hypothetical protein